MHQMQCTKTLLMRIWRHIQDWAIMMILMALVCLPTFLALKDIGEKKQAEIERRQSLWRYLGEDQQP